METNAKAIFRIKWLGKYFGRREVVNKFYSDTDSSLSRYNLIHCKPPGELITLYLI